jgi:hypothetical protein
MVSHEEIVEVTEDEIMVLLGLKDIEIYKLRKDVTAARLNCVTLGKALKEEEEKCVYLQNELSIARSDDKGIS